MKQLEGQYVMEGCLESKKERKIMPVPLLNPGDLIICRSCGALLGKNKEIKYCAFCGIRMKIYTDAEKYKKAKEEYGKTTF